MEGSFNPSNPEYKKVEDLPQEEQSRFVNVEGGFVQKTALGKPTKRPREIYASDKTYGRSFEEEALNFIPYVTNKNFLINEAPKLIQEGDFYEGIAIVAEKLGIKVDFDKDHGYERIKIAETIERLTNILLEITNEFDEDASVALKAVVDFTIKFKGAGYRSWSHNVCHTIEKYGESNEVSFLNTAKSREILIGLVDESVKRQKEDESDIGCSSRIVGPIARYNLVEAGFDNLEAQYAYKPESLSDNKYVEILRNGLDSSDDDYVSTFLASNSPLEFYRITLEKGSDLPSFLSIERKIELMQHLEKYLTREVVDNYVRKVYHPNGQDITYEELVQSFKQSKEAHEVVKGIYVDVEGTLIRQNYEGYGLNQNLVKKLITLADEGKNIIIFTGGDAEILGEELKKLGLPERFLPVRSKNEYRGKVLEVLVDDTPPEYQGFKTLELRDPKYAW